VAAAAAGVGVATYVNRAGGVKAILESAGIPYTPNAYGASPAAGVGGLEVLATPLMAAGVTAPISPVQAQQLFTTPAMQAVPMPALVVQMPEYALPAETMGGPAGRWEWSEEAMQDVFIPG